LALPNIYNIGRKRNKVVEEGGKENGMIWMMGRWMNKTYTDH
jgi:hypothetical protein